jgi:hypothetical protein
MTVLVGFDGLIITVTPPIVRKFQGQTLENLIAWMRRQPGFYGKIL